MANPLDKYGLGDFASMLSGDVIPKRPSEEIPEKPIPDYLIVSGSGKKGAKMNNISPDKDKPAWKFGKQKFPRILRKAMEGADELEELHCGCKCKECISNYRSYWEEKSYSTELQKALDEERESMKSVLLEVGKLEYDYKNKLSHANLTVDVVEDKYRVIT
jgi:hypothetical protein